MSTLQALRQRYLPKIPSIFKSFDSLCLQPVDTQHDPLQKEQLFSLFPHTWGKPFLFAAQGEKWTSKAKRVGVVFSGGQAAGGHTVIAGLFDALKKLDQESVLWGFLGGPSGLIEGKGKEITQELLADYRHQGGFDLIGSGRTKISTEEQLASSLKTVLSLHLDGLVIIGGDDSNTTAAVLAEYFQSKKASTCVIGVPKTIDGDLQHSYVPISFGFDTACKTYAEIIGNIARDALSAKKYYHFIKLMGRSASHVTLECALVTHPNSTLIGEEVSAEKKTLQQITEELADLVIERSKEGKQYGIILIPEGLIEFIPEFNALISELNLLLSSGKEISALSSASSTCFKRLPETIQKQLLLERDSHGNVQLSFIETEKLLMEMVSLELKKRGYKGAFNPIAHFLGYEGRAAFPTNFDCNYCYTLGMTAALLIAHEKTGYMVCVPNVTEDPSMWKVGGIPLTTMLHLEMRKGVLKPVIEKTLVALKSPLFQKFQEERKKWRLQDSYGFPGPIQFSGDPSVTDTLPISIYCAR